MRVPDRYAAADTREPAGEVGEGQGTSRRYGDGLDKLQKGEKIDLLCVVLVVMGEVERTGVVHQEGGVGHIEDLARKLAQLLDRQHRLAAAGRADQDQRRGMHQGVLLILVERENLVEQMDVRPLGIDVGQRQAVFGQQRFGTGNRRQLRLVHHGPPQEARRFIGVVADDFEQDQAGLAAPLAEAEDQAVGIRQLGPVERAGVELLDVGRAKIARRELHDGALERLPESRVAQVVVLQDAHSG